MEEVPPAIARAIVLRQLPRALRAGLDPEAANGPIPAQLAADAEATLPGLGPVVATWIRDNVGHCPGVALWLGDVGSEQPATDDPASGGLAALDQAAAARDVAALREIADALVLLGAYDRLAPLAGRAAAATWPYLDRMPEGQERLHQLGLASIGTSTPDGVVRAPWPELDALGHPAPRPGIATDAAEGAWRTAIDAAYADLCREARLLVIGLSAIAGGGPSQAWHPDTLAQAAVAVGRSVTEPLTRSAVRDARRSVEDQVRSEIEDLRAIVRTFQARPGPASKPEPEAIPPGHVLVCPELAPTGAGKGKDIARGYEHAIGRAMPLVPTPDLAGVRRALAAEFPHAVGAIDAILGAFSARPHVHAEPLVVAGPSGAGKSRLVRKLGAALGVGVYRVDGSNDAGGSFGGTERRWYSSEPCRPFMAIARHRHANPIVLVDEVDKAATRSDYGRLWDAMLQALDPEGAARFPDPSLQVDLDISWVSVVCTANEPSVLPGALLDRMRIVRFPEPGAEHLDALLPGVMADIAREAGLDPRFHAPLDGIELVALRARWRGGSLRRLRRAVEAILRVRDRSLAGRSQ